MTSDSSTNTRLAERGALLQSLLQREKSGHLRRIALWGGLRVIAGVALGAVVLFVIAALTSGLPRIVGLLLAAAAWAGFAFLAWRYWVRPLGAVPNLATFTQLVEERRDFRDLLRAALEFSQRGVPVGLSSDLVGVTVDRAYDEAKGLHLTQLFEFPHRRRDALTAAAALAAIVVLCVVAPNAPGRVARGLAFQWPAPGEIQYGALDAVSGDRTVLAGESVDVVVRENGPQAPEMVLRFNDTGDLWKSRNLLPVAQAEPRDYTFRFDDVRSDLTYRFESGRRHTPDHRITVVQRPIVSQLRLRLVPPPYTGHKPIELEEGRGDAVALRGTRVEIEALASSPLASAQVVPDAADAAGAAATLPEPLPMQTQGKTFRAHFVLRGDMPYHFELVDSLGHSNADPVTYRLSAVEDREPYVEMRAPGQDIDLPPSQQVPMGIYAADDYGISKMTLFYRAEQSEPAPETGMEPEKTGGETAWSHRAIDVRGTSATDPDGRPLGAGTPAEVLQSFTWSVADAGLFPGDAMLYFVEVEDNDAVSGHKKARTQTFRLRLQTMSELYAKIHQGDEKRMTQLDDAIEKGRQLKDKYEKLARELKKTPDVDWQKQKEIEGALEKQKQLAEQVQKIAEDLEKSVSKMQDQQAVSQEIAQKMDEIRKLMEQVQDETMKKYMEQLQEAMKQISPEEVQRAMEQMKGSQEEFMKRLERTKSLLEQLKRSQDLDAMVERVAELLHNQEQIGEKTQKLDGDKQDADKPKGGDKDKKDGDPSKSGDKQKSDSNKDQDSKSGEQGEKKTHEQLAQEQKNLGDKTDELQKDLEKLSEEAKKSGQEQLDQAQQQMQQENPSGEMQEASKDLQSQQSSEAQQHQQSAEKSLRALYKQLMEAQQSMSAQAEQADTAALQKAARQSLDVSFRQEGVTKQTPSVARAAAEGDLAEQQQALVAAGNKIITDLDAMAQKSAAAPAQITTLLGEAVNHMRAGVKSYEKGDGITGRIQGEQAYGILNKVVVELNRSASSSCKKPGNGKGAQQKLDQLMGRQQQLNDKTRQLQKEIPSPQNLSPEQRAQMSRLLGEQRAIAGQLQDIERQAAEQRELLGRLDKMQDEMHEVVQDMQSEQLDEQTVRVQEKIVSRMLDAQRSLHKRDFNEERESRTAEDVFSKGGRMPQDNDKAKKLRRDIDRALRDGTPEEYEDLVREYFRAISEAPGAPQAGPVPR